MAGELVLDLASIGQAKEWISDAESVLITAGAGLTAAAGINYSDTELFAREFPAMGQYGFNAQYELIGRTDLDPELFWGYWAAHVNLVRYRWPQTTPYQQLHEIAALVDSDASFVFTSNVDAMFERNGFEPTRIHTPQGDYALMQCTTPCTRNVWTWKDQLDAIRAATDPKTHRTDPSLVPRCPTCGETVWINVRIDNTFIDDHYQTTADKFAQWVKSRRDNSGVVIEVGAGFNTPSVIRWPSEAVVDAMPDWNLIRINLTHATTSPTASTAGLYRCLATRPRFWPRSHATTNHGTTCERIHHPGRPHDPPYLDNQPIHARHNPRSTPPRVLNTETATPMADHLNINTQSRDNWATFVVAETVDPNHIDTWEQWATKTRASLEDVDGYLGVVTIPFR